MAKKTSVPVAPEAKEVLGAVKTVPTKAPVPGMDGVGAKTVAKQLVKREEEEKEVVSDMDAQAAEALAQEAPVLVAQAATGAAPTSSDSAAAVSVQAATSAPAAAAAVNPLWLGLGALGLAAAAGGGGGDEPPPRYSLTSKQLSVNEGDAVVFTLVDRSKGVGDRFDYVISGVQAADVEGGALTGTAVIGADGKAEIRVQLVADRATDSGETLTLAVAGQTKSVAVNDTSVSPTFTLERSAEAVDEGQTAVFTLQTTNVDQGASFDYVITGVQAADVVGGALTGKAVIDANGRAEIRVVLVEDNLSEGAQTLKLSVAGQELSVVVNDTSFDPVFEFTQGTDLYVGANAGTADDNIYVGRVGSNFSGSGSPTTFQDGDAVDAGGGSNTLRLFMDPGATADGVDVSNIQTLDLRLTAGQVSVSATKLFMTDWDASLEQMNIRSNKSNLVVHEQKTIADISITDQSTENQASSYDFSYAAGVLDGSSDLLKLSVDNVNGENGADVEVDAGMESIAINVADRQGTLANPNLYASDIKLTAAGVDEIDVTGGRTGQTFGLNADLVAEGSDFDSTEFDGNMDLESNKILTARFGDGDDKVVIDGQANDSDASYDLGEGDNTIDINDVDLGGAIIAGDGKNTVNVNNVAPNGNVLATGSITLGDGGNTVKIDADHAGAVTTGFGADTVTAKTTAAGSTIAVGEGNNSVEIEQAHAGSISAGDGNNTIAVGSTTGETEVEEETIPASEILLGNGDNRVTVEGDHAGNMTAGDGNNLVFAQANVVEDATLGLGDGNNVVEIAGEIDGATGEDATGVVASLGNGDNTVTVGGSVAAQVITLTTVIPSVVSDKEGDMAFELATEGGTTYRIFFDQSGANPETRATIQKKAAGAANFTAVALNTTDTEAFYASIAAELGADRIDFFDSAPDVLAIWAYDESYDRIVSAKQVNEATFVEVSNTKLDIENDQFVPSGECQTDVENATVTFGDGTNFMQVDGSVINSRIEFGNGDENELTVGGNVSAAVPTSIVFGDGKENTLTIGGNLSGDDVVFGDGADNSFDIGGNVINGASITLGDGGNSGTIAGDVTTGSTITFGDGADELTIGALGEDGNTAEVSGVDVETTISMGAGDDQVTLLSEGTAAYLKSITFSFDGLSGTNTIPLNSETNFIYAAVVGGALEVHQNQDVFGQFHNLPGVYGVDWGVTVTNNTFTVTNLTGRYPIVEALDGAIATGDNFVSFTNQSQTIDPELVMTGDVVVSLQSGAFLGGGADNDTLTLNAEDDANLIARTNAQVSTINLGTAPFVFGDEITVTFTRGDEEFTVSVTADELTQGPENLAATVAGLLREAINGDAKVSPIFTAANTGSLITLTSDNPHEDFAISWQVNDGAAIDATVVQISDTRITSFETLDLVALDSDGVDNIAIGANFDLIDGTNTVKLDSQVERDETSTDADHYDTFVAGGATTYNLSNLKGGEAIHVAGHEASATGNRQVELITVGDDDGDHEVGDELTLSINGVELDPYVVTAANLVADTAVLDAASIASSLAEHITQQLGEDSPWEVKLDGNQIYLIGQSGENVPVSLAHTREGTVNVVEDSGDSPVDAKPWVSQLKAGDVITVTLGGDEYEYTVLAEDLDPFCTRTHAEIITEKLAALVPEASAQWGVLTLPGSYSISVDRVQMSAVDSITTLTQLQAPAPSDDVVTDVVINATLAEGATGMDLTVDGYGNFDIAITGGEDSGYTDLDMTLADEFSHTVDTGGQLGNFAESITVADAEGVDTAGQTVTLDNVLAHTVSTTGSEANFAIATGSEANFAIDQLSVREGNVADFAGETISVTTGNGDDHLTTLAQSAMASDSSIDLGTGSNTLSLGWGTNVTLDSADLEDVGYINYAGGLTQLDILSDVELDQASTTLTMPSGVGGVETVTFTNVGTSDGQRADLSIEGAANDLALVADNNFNLGNTVLDVSSFRDFATELPAGVTTVTGQIDQNQDAFYGSDVYKFVHTGGRLVLTFNSSAPTLDDLNILLFNESGQALYGEDAEPAVIDLVLPAGTYFVAVGPNNIGAFETEEKFLNDDGYFFSNDNGSNDPETQNGVVFELVGGESGPYSEDSLYGPYTLTFSVPTGGSVASAGATVAESQLVDGVAGLGVLTATDASGAEITGALTVKAGGDVLFNIGNNQLDSLTVTAGEDAAIYLSGNDSDAEFNLGAVSISSNSTTSEAANFFVLNNNGTTVNVSSIDVTSGDGTRPDADLEIENNTGLVMTAGTVTLTGDDPDLYIEDNAGSSISLGAVSITDPFSGDTASIDIERNTDSAVTLASVDINSANDGRLAVGRTIDGSDGNTDSTVTVTGDVSMDVYEYAYLEIEGNTRTDVSVAADGTVTLVACEYDADVSITGNVNDHDPFEEGGPDNGSLISRSYAITLGDVVMNAGDDTFLNIQGNSDDTYWGHLSITVGNVDMLAYDNADLNVGGFYDEDGNQATTIDIGTVDMRVQDNGSVVIGNNDGRIYENLFVNPSRDEPDFADISIDKVTIDADEQAYMGIGENRIARIDVDGVSLTGDTGAGIEIVYNGNSSDGVLSVPAQVPLPSVVVDLGDVEVTATTGLAGVTIGVDYTGRFGTAGGQNGGNDDTHVIIGELEITAEGSASDSSVEANLIIANNEGEDGQGMVDIEKVTTSSARSTNFLVYNNALSGAAALAADISVGDVDMTADINANLSIFRNGPLDEEVMKMSFGDVALTADNQDQGEGNAQFEFGSNDSDSPNPANDDVDATFGTVTLTGSDAKFLVKGNTYTTAEFGNVTMNGDGSDAVIDLKIIGNSDSSIELGAIDIDSSDDAFMTIGGNDDSFIKTGNVDIDADNTAYFDISGNVSDSVVEVAVTRATSGDNAGAVTNRGSITIDAAGVGAYFPFAASTNYSTYGGFVVGANTGSDVYLGNMAITAKVAIDPETGLTTNDPLFADIVARISTGDDGIGEDSTVVDIGDFDATAGGDIYVDLDGLTGEDSTLNMGDITLTSGDYVPAVTGEDTPEWSSDLFFRAVSLNGNNDNDSTANNNTTGAGVDNGQQITLTAKSVGGDDEGNVYAHIDRAPDLNLLTVSGTNAEIYLEGQIGENGSVNSLRGSFTLDLSGMTGTFGDITTYDPLGASAGLNSTQDDGTYVVTVGATFDNDLRDVVVKIGTGDLVYNAQHSSFNGAQQLGGTLNETDDLTYTRKFDREVFDATWESTGHGDFNEYGYHRDWNSQEGWYSLGQTDLEATPTVQTVTGFSFGYGWDGYDDDENYDDTITLDFADGTNLSFTDGGYVNMLDAIVSRTGAESASWDPSTNTLRIYGPNDGSALPNAITSATVTYERRIYDDNDIGEGGNEYEYFIEQQNLGLSITDGVLATDGSGSTASEVFTFSADGIGEVVIGGFRPNGVDGLTGEIDYLDFTALGFDQSSDLIFTIDDSDGYFADLIIDFRDAPDLGSIRLVGVGEYYENAQEFANSGSIIFA